MDEQLKTALINATAIIVSGANDASPLVIQSVHATLKSLAADEPAEAPQPRGDPAVPIDQSVTPDYIVSLEDGKKFKSLKRHLRAAYGMTPEEYRAKWGLPHDYPMVAPNYAAARSQLAKDMGLGRKADVKRAA